METNVSERNHSDRGRNEISFVPGCRGNEKGYRMELYQVTVQTWPQVKLLCSKETSFLLEKLISSRISVGNAISCKYTLHFLATRRRLRQRERSNAREETSREYYWGTQAQEDGSMEYVLGKQGRGL